MTKMPATDKARWPFGYRILLWLVGSVAVVALIVAVLFVLSAPH